MGKLDNSKNFDHNLKPWSDEEILSAERDAVAWTNGLTLLDDFRDATSWPEFKVTSRFDTTGLPKTIELDLQSDGSVEACLDLSYQHRSLNKVTVDKGCDGRIEATISKGTLKEDFIQYVEFKDIEGKVEALGKFAAHDIDHKKKSFDVKDPTTDKLIGSLTFSHAFPEIKKYHIDAYGDGRGLRDSPVRRNRDKDISHF